VMDKWLINGLADEVITADDRGLSYGDGLFETIAVRDGACRFWSEHMARLRSGCQRLGLPAPVPEQLERDAHELIGAAERGTLKMIVTAGRGPRGYRRPQPVASTRLVGFSVESAPGPREKARVRLCATPWGSNRVLAGMKTLNRLEQVLARAEWDSAGIAEGVMLGAHGRIVSGTMSNLFIVVEGQLLTPRLDACGVHGIMRAKVFDVAGRLGLACREEDLPGSLLKQADDMFLTNALWGAWPVERLDEYLFAGSEVTARIMDGLLQLGVTECRC